MTISAILVNENKATPLSDAFDALGVAIVRDQWEPDDGLLQSIGACFVSFYDCLRRPVDIHRLRRRLNDRNIPLVAWNRDAPGYLNKPAYKLWLLERFQPLDIYFSHALPDTRRFAATQVLLHNAANLAAYNLNGRTLDELDDPAHYRWDVSFFGAIDSSRYKEYEARTRFFKQLSEALDKHSISCRIIDTLRTPLSLSEQIELIQSSRISLNFGAGCEYGAAIGYGLPERCFGIPACGGFLLSDYRLHARDAFPGEQEWADFTSLNDAIEKIRFYLAHFDESRTIARNAHRRVIAEHTYADRARQAIRCIEDWKDNRPDHAR